MITLTRGCAITIAGMAAWKYVHARLASTCHCQSVTLMRRWKLETWFDDRPSMVLKSHWNNPCSLCVIDRVIEQAYQMELAHARKAGTALWIVSVLDGVVNGYKVKFRSKTLPGRLPTRHVCGR